MASKSDGKVVISTELDNSGLSNGIEQAKGKLGGLGNVVSKLVSTIAAAFSVKIIANFAKECLDLGSDLQEVQNVVDVTFTAMNKQVNEFARNAAQTAGLSETMAKKYTGTFGAMAKSFKFTEAEAYEMSTALTQMAGDVASFYNLSQDQAYTKLKSVFTGETESLKDLGVVMTQTALDSYALAKGFGKTTSKMTEQEKVALRYQFVMEQLSGASGDFTRTADSWANQTRILSLRFEQLKATIGQGLINVLTPVIKLINTLLTKLQEVADTFLEFTNSLFGNAGDSAASSSEEVADSYDSAAGSAENLEESTKEIKKTLAGFDELNVLNSGKDDESSWTGDLSTGTNNVVDGDVKDKISPKIQGIVDKIKKLIEPLQNIDFSSLKESFSGLGDSLGGFGERVSEALEWVWFNILVPLSEWTIEEAAPAVVDALSEAFDSLSSAIDAVREPAEDLWFNTLKPMIDTIGEWVLDIVNQTSDSFGYMSEKLEEYKDEIAMVIEGIGAILSIIWAIISPIIGSAVDGIWNVLKSTIDFIFSIIQVVGNFFSFFKNIFLAIVNLFKGNFDEAGKYAKQALANFVNIFVGIGNAIISVINNLWTLIFDAFKGIVNSVGGLISKIGEWVGFDWDLQWNATAPLIPTIPKYVPALARGAVIPPNKEFLAVLGDQRSGTNIEAPLETIKQAMADVLAENGTGADGQVIERLDQILSAILGIEVGDTTIGKAANRYNEKMAIITGRT